MTLLEYMSNTPPGEEITVWDKDYDLEVYFYNQEYDAWDSAMMDLAGKLNVVEVRSNGVVVDMYDLIERNLDNIDGLFYDPDIDSIMGSMESILSGNASEDWFAEFVSYLE